MVHPLDGRQIQPEYRRQLRQFRQLRQLRQVRQSQAKLGRQIQRLIEVAEDALSPCPFFPW